MKLSLFHREKKTDFYKLLVDHARTVYEAYTILVRGLESGDSGAADRVYFLERDADDLRRILIDRLNRTLITPFDREDIYALSRAVDEIIDAAQRTVEELHIFNVQPDDDLIAMAKVLEKGTLEIYDALKNMKQYSTVALEHAKLAKATENQIHHIYLKALADLFENPQHTPGYMLKMREIYRHLNRSADNCDEAANIISDIIIKTS
ncbi:MAG: DUF47 family protein [Spirochaetaceae bacterium]|nr:MAG: DUF47 family protein [Spirochaetaceae bacterium]